MLLFSTIIEINDSLTKNDFISLAIEWNKKSKYSENIIQNIDWHGERNVSFYSDCCSMHIAECKKENIIAIRYEKHDNDGVIWNTDYIMNFNTGKMSVHLDRSYLESALRLNGRFSAPHFISMLIDGNYIKDDNGIKVSRTPHFVGENDISLIADIINGKIKYNMPVVYVSTLKNGKYPIDVNMLASKLKGIAHVIVQSSISLNENLRILCNDQNEYFGAIGLYYPEENSEHRKYMYHCEEGYDKIQFEKIVKAVIQYSNSQLTDTLFTWQGIKNAILLENISNQEKKYKNAIAELKSAREKETELKEIFDKEKEAVFEEAKEKAEQGAYKLIENFDDEIYTLKKQIEENSKDIERLQTENQGLKAKLNESDTLPVIFMGNETDFYPNEIKDIILTALSDLLKATEKHTRRYDILNDIIENNDFENMTNKKAEELRKLLNGYSGMSSRLKNDLENLGLQISDEGKHYKITYYGDGRYTTSLAKTPSDNRTGKNSVKYIKQMAF